MVNKTLQEEVRKKAEEMFTHYDRLELIEGELQALGFTRKGANPHAVTMENTDLELFLIIGLTKKGGIESFEIMPFEDLKIMKE
jgi:hypothetical protein